MLLQIIDQHGALLSVEVTAMVTDDFAGIAESDDVAADGHVAGLHLIADAGGFERAATLI